MDSEQELYKSIALVHFKLQLKINEIILFYCEHEAQTEFWIYFWNLQALLFLKIKISKPNFYIWNTVLWYFHILFFYH